MSDFLRGFVAEDYVAPREKTSSKYMNDPVPKRRKKTSGPAAAPTQIDKSMYKNDDSIRCIFNCPKRPPEEIVIPKFEKLPLTFLNKSIILYGGSGSGKTFLIYDIMNLMKNIFPTVFVFSPTENERGDFAKKIPSQLIDEDLKTDKISNIYLRQKATSNYYIKASKISILYCLFKKIATVQDHKNHKKLINARTATIAYLNKTYADPGIRKTKIESIGDIFKIKFITYYKNVIKPKIHILLKQKLTQAEQDCIKYINLNPRILIIFDDATTEILNLIKEGKKRNDETIKNFFFKGRHTNITHIYSFHDDGKLDSDIRKNAFYSIFCSQTAALSFFGKTANSFSTLEKKKGRNCH